jgi:predicted secreted protein
VDSLNVTDAAAILTAIKSLTPFTLMWDETSVTDNQTGEQAAFARTGQAYLNDATFNFNDRENSTKQLKFTGSGELSKITTTPTYEPVDASVYTKGQFVRLFLGSDNTTTPAAVIAAARQLSFHVSMSLENATTKDTPGDWQIQEPTGLSYDISSTALMRGNDTISSSVAGKSLADIEDIYEAGTPVKFQIANVSGDNQRTKGAVIVSGSVIIATLTLNGPNRQNADYTTALNGYGAYTVGA